MTGDSGTVNLPFTSSSGTCCVYLGATKLPIGCIYTSSPTEVDYILTVHEEDLLPESSDLQIVHYGLTTNSSYSTQDFDLKCYSLMHTTTPGSNDLIFQSLGVPFKYDSDDSSYIGASAITLSGYTQKINNKAAVTEF